MSGRDSPLAERVVVVPYDPAWSARFEALRDELLATMPGHFVAIEHFGSTSVVGLAAKPVIDIIASVTSLASVEAAVERLASIDYVYVPDFNTVMPERRYFRRPRDGAHMAHLHVYELAEFARRPERRFRDALRAHPDLAAAYAALKYALAVQFGADRAGYTEAKTAFVHAHSGTGDQGGG